MTAGEAQHKADKATASASNATTIASGATREADAVHQEVGKASNQLTQFEAEAQKTKSDLNNFAICNAPRVILNWFLGTSKTYIDPLRPMAGQLVFIEVVPDPEARRAALDLARTLTDAQWSVQKPFKSVDGLSDGISVQASIPPKFTGGEIPDMYPFWRASDAAEALLGFLHLYNWQAVRGVPMDSRGNPIRDESILPARAIRIQVGLYPASVYVSPPGQKEFAAAVEARRLEREKAEAESRRRRDEGFAAFPPAARKKLQQEAEEWEARTKSETSNGPCQVLNPLF